MISVTGTAEAPAKVGVPISDLNAGLFASHAILAALLARARTGEGQYIDTSLFEASLAYTIWESNEYWASDTSPQGLGTAHRLAAPYQVFPTADGWIAIGAANQRNWERLASAIQRTDLLSHPLYSTNSARLANVQSLANELSATLQTRSTTEWLPLLEAADVPCGPVLNLEQVYQHEHTHARAMDITSDHPIAGPVHAIGFPVKYSATPPQLYRPAPTLGQHTREILTGLGLDAVEIQNLATMGITV
jgi:formyl-CoA transferase